jgi:hypothetical protein
MIRTTVTPIGTTGIVESEFCGGPAWVLYVPSTWPISGTFVDPDQHVFRVLVVVEDFSAVWVSEFTVDVPPPALTISTQSPLPNGTAGTAYSESFSAAGGVAPYTWSAAGLPAGWQMSTTGQLTASTQQPGTYNFDVTVTDSYGYGPGVATLPFAVTIDPLPPLQIVTTALPTGTAGHQYSATLTASGGSGSGYYWTLVSGALPPGVTGLPGAGVPSVSLGGTPTSTGLYSFEVGVSDNAGNSTTANLSIQIDVQGLGAGGGDSDSAGGCAAASDSATACWWLVWLVALAPAMLLRRARD